MSKPEGVPRKGEN